MKVRDLIRKLRKEGWVLDHTSGDHRQFTHPAKPGMTTVAGHPNDTMPIKTLLSVLKQAGPRK